MRVKTKALIANANLSGELKIKLASALQDKKNAAKVLKQYRKAAKKVLAEQASVKTASVQDQPTLSLSECEESRKHFAAATLHNGTKEASRLPEDMGDKLWL